MNFHLNSTPTYVLCSYMDRHEYFMVANADAELLSNILLHGSTMITRRIPWESPHMSSMLIVYTQCCITLHSTLIICLIMIYIYMRSTCRGLTEVNSSAQQEGGFSWRCMVHVCYSTSPSGQHCEQGVI